MINTTNKSAKMASFSSGIMLSRSEAQRQKGDELRMRAAGIDPTKIDEQWLGEVMSRRQKKEAKVDEDVEKEKKLAAELPMEKSEVVAKKPEGRLTWLHKALVLAAKGRIAVPQIYSIIQSSKFTSGVSNKVGLKMKGLVLANLHLFKKEQQKSLQNGRLMDFSKDGGSGSEEKKKSKKRKQSESYSGSSRSRSSRSERRSSSVSRSRKKKKKRKKEKEKDRSRSHDDRSHDEKREKEKEREKESEDGVKKKKKDKAAKEKKEEKAAKEEKAHKEKKEEKSKKDKSHKEEKVKEKPGKDEKKSKAAREAAAKLAQAEEELAKAAEEEQEEAEEEPEELDVAMSSTSFQEASQLDARFPPQAAPAGAMGTVKMKLSGWKPACLRM